MFSVWLFYYLFGKTVFLTIFVLSYLTAVYLYIKGLKSYFPKMKNRETNQYFHEKYPEFLKADLHKLSLFRVFIGVLTFFWIRLFLHFLSVFLIYLVAIIFSFFKNLSSPFESQKQLDRIATICKIFNYLSIISSGVIIKEVQVNCDEEYKKYLGPNYTKTDFFTTIISNHSSWLDITYISQKYFPAFVGKESLKKAPFLGKIGELMQHIFLDRASKEKRHEALDKIVDRLKSLADGKLYNKLCIFPEGTNTNGKIFIDFKIGPFSALTPVKPLFSNNFSSDQWNATTGIMNLGIHMFLTMTFLYTEATYYEMPVFAPNDYLFENHSHLGSNKIEIFMNAVKEVMSKVSGLKTSHSSFAQKLEYLSEIKGRKVSNT